MADEDQADQNVREARQAAADADENLSNAEQEAADAHEENV